MATMNATWGGWRCRISQSWYGGNGTTNSSVTIGTSATDSDGWKTTTTQDMGSSLNPTISSTHHSSGTKTSNMYTVCAKITTPNVSNITAISITFKVFSQNDKTGDANKLFACLRTTSASTTSDNSSSWTNTIGSEWSTDVSTSTSSTSPASVTATFTGSFSANTSYYMFLYTKDNGTNGPAIYGIYDMSDVFGTPTVTYTPTYTVSYNNGGRGTAPDSQSVTAGNSLTLQSAMSNQAGTSYKVSYNANGGSSTPSSSTSAYTYKHTKWAEGSTSGTQYSPGASYTPSDDVTMYGIWSGSRASVTLADAISRANGTATRTVTFNANGGSCSTASLASTATITYTFSKWAAGSTSGTQYSAGASFKPSANTTMYAIWSSSTGSYSAITLPTPTRTGYTFKGWSTSSTATSGTTGSYTPTGDVTLYATWEVNTWTVSYNANGHGTAPAAQTKIYGTDLTLQGFISQQTGTGYTVSFNANNGTSTPDALTSTLTYDQTYWNTAADGSGTNYASKGAYATNAAATMYAIWKTTNGSVTLPSAISRNDSEEAGFKVTFNANGGSCATTELTAVNTRKYTFSKWAEGSTSGTQYSAGASYTPTADKTMYAIWSESVTKGSVVLPTPTRTGYTFKGWSTSSTASSGTAAGNSYIPTATTTLYATWQINTWTVSYNANGHGTAPSSQTKTYGQALTLQSFISQQTGTGYTVSFNKNGGTTTPSSLTSNIYYNQTSWNTTSDGSGDSYSSQGSYTANTGATLYAIWSSSNGSVTLPAAIARDSSTETGFEVTFNANGGSCSTSNLTATNTRNYTFKQWTAGSTSGTGYNAGTSFTPTGTTTMYATWNETVVEGSITLPVPTRDGYTFVGWATSASASTGVTGEYTPSSDVTLYAIWNMNNSIVHYNNNGTDTSCVVYYNNNGTAVICNVYYNNNGTAVRI